MATRIINTRLMPAFSALLAVVAVLFIASCSKVNCLQPSIDGFYFYSSDTIMDTGIVIRKYEAATNFTRLVDSTAFGSNVLCPYGVHYTSLGAVYNAPSGYDYLLLLLPSGKTHRVTGISIGNDKIYAGEYKDSYCVSSWSCRADDSLESSPMMPNESVQPGFTVYFRY